LTEALVKNPKLEQTPEGGFLFKAPFKIRDKKGLIRLLKQHDLKGLGGVLLDDIKESLPHCEKALKVRVEMSWKSIQEYSVCIHMKKIAILTGEKI